MPCYEWSHSHEAYANAERNLQFFPIEILREMYAEWKANSKNDKFNERKYKIALNKLVRENTPKDLIVEFLWEKISDYRTCGDGFFNAYGCPAGCYPHQIPFGYVYDSSDRKDTRYEWENLSLLNSDKEEANV